MKQTFFEYYLNWHLAIGFCVFAFLLVAECFMTWSVKAVIERHCNLLENLLGQLFGYRIEVNPGVALLFEAILTSLLWPFLILSAFLK